ncbi:MAG: aminotransferase class V-fold PLP-dependent enzyme, partial [Victivallales bacterium]|nr:aminotransferase class V-fold PLP-dependent enzyme [Victivallales bacterium]
MINGPAIPAVNLDAAAAMPMYPGFPQRYAEYLRQYEVNPHGVTCFAARCRQALENAAERLMLAAGAPSGRYHVIWCSSATEAVNIGLHSLCGQLRPQKVLYDAGGHPALRHTAAAAAPGRTVCTLHTPQGTMLIPEDAAQCTLAALSLVNSENGAVWHGDKSPLPRECRLLLDASQGFGLHPVPWHSATPDMVVFSAHKMGAAGNTAALMCRRDIQLTPLFSGGGQQNGIRPGTIH